MKLYKQIDALLRAGTAAGLTDGDLLDRFVGRRDELAEAAFTALVDRHGALVLRVCRQVLRNEHDAEEAAQATFLVLARRASSIRRRDSVAAWLHGVAVRIAANARVAAVRRRTHERRGAELMAHDQEVARDAQAVVDTDRFDVLHEELARLPQAFRSVVVACDLQGSTQEQAAAQMGCPLGTVQSRLARGRAKLKARLERRGVEFSGLAAARHILPSNCPPPADWAEATVDMAMRFAGRRAGEAATSASAALAEEVVRAVVLGRLTRAAIILLVGALLISGAAAWVRRARKAVAPVVTARDEPKKVGVDPPAQKASNSPESVTRIIRGIVRDEQGRPVPKAWVGSGVFRRDDLLMILTPPVGIRERREPYRDEQGKVVPPGPLGKYFELLDETGNWQPLDPARVERANLPFRAIGEATAEDLIGAPNKEAVRPDPAAASTKPIGAVAAGREQPALQVRTRGRWEMRRNFWRRTH